MPYDSVRASRGRHGVDRLLQRHRGGSRTTFATGMAVVQACEDIIRAVQAARGGDLGTSTRTRWTGRTARRCRSRAFNVDVQPLSLADIAGNAGRTGGPILGRASLNAQGAGASFSVNMADVTVDRETGKVDVQSFTAIQDAGTAIHRAYVEGQLQGGAVQGLGWALNEEYVYDANGEMENAGFLDYRVPVTSDMPMIDTHIVEVPNPSHPYGVRGVGETPIVATAGGCRERGARRARIPHSGPAAVAPERAGGDRRRRRRLRLRRGA